MTLYLDALQRAAQTARELQTRLAEIAPLIEGLHKLGDATTVPLPTDRLIRAGEAAKVLGDWGNLNAGDYQDVRADLGSRICQRHDARCGTVRLDVRDVREVSI